MMKEAPRVTIMFNIILYNNGSKEHNYKAHIKITTPSRYNTSMYGYKK
jgi:hypothetical protein